MQDFPATDPSGTSQLPPAGTTVSDNSWAAITSLVIGIVGLCGSWIPFCGWLFPIAGVILGYLGLKSRQRTLAIVGIILSGLVLLGWLLSLIFGFGSSILNSIMSSFNF